MAFKKSLDQSVEQSERERMARVPIVDEMIQTTIEYYNQNAKRFWLGTQDHDVSQNYAALLEALPQEKKLTILDFGCGPGRDLVYFTQLGHEAIGLDACPEFCQMAREHSGCEVLQQNFCELSLKDDSLDGIFANASLFHVPKVDLPRILGEFYQALKPQGILFSSNPRGTGEDFDGKRYAHYMEFEEYQQYLTDAHFTVLTHYYRPQGLAREDQPWLAVVAQRG